MFNFDRYSQLFSAEGQARRRRRAFLTSVLLHLLAFLALLAFILFPRFQRPQESYLVIDVGTPALSSNFVNAAAADANAPSSDQVDVAAEALGVTQSAEAPEAAGAENPVEVSDSAAFEATSESTEEAAASSESQEDVALSAPLPVPQPVQPVEAAPQIAQPVTEPVPDPVDEVTAVPIEEAVVPENVIEEAPDFSENIETEIDTPLETNQEAISALIEASESLSTPDETEAPLATEISVDAAQQLINLQESLLVQPDSAQPVQVESEPEVAETEQASVSIGENALEEVEPVDVVTEETVEATTAVVEEVVEASESVEEEVASTDDPQTEEQTATAPDLSAGISASPEITEQSNRLSAAALLNNIRDRVRNTPNEEFTPPRAEEEPVEVVETPNIAPSTMFLAPTEAPPIPDAEVVETPAEEVVEAPEVLEPPVEPIEEVVEEVVEPIEVTEEVEVVEPIEPIVLTAQPLEEIMQPLADIMNVQNAAVTGIGLATENPTSEASETVSDASESAEGNPEVLAFSEDNNENSNSENVEGDNLTGSANVPAETAPEGGTDSIPRQTGEPTDNADPDALGRAAGPDGSILATGAPLPPEPFSMTKERPLAVMTDNVYGYPQNGLRETSTVFEMPVEGGLTRLMLIFDKDTPARVGPIRSARDYFLDVSDGLGSVLVHVGGSPSALARIERQGTQTFDGLRSGLFARDNSRTAPYNTYSAGGDIRREMTRLGWNRVESIRGVIFKPDDELPEVVSKNIRFSREYSSGFRYVQNLASYQWVRNGRDAVDANGVAVKTDAVVLATTAASVIPGDSAGRLNVNTRSGLATLYIQGKAIDGQWSSQGGFSFVSNEGERIDLSPFKTWITFVPPWATVN